LQVVETGQGPERLEAVLKRLVQEQPVHQGEPQQALVSVLELQGFFLAHLGQSQHWWQFPGWWPAMVAKKVLVLKLGWLLSPLALAEARLVRLTAIAHSPGGLRN
jgi:hypothetical protein